MRLSEDLQNLDVNFLVFWGFPQRITLSGVQRVTSLVFESFLNICGNGLGYFPAQCVNFSQKFSVQPLLS